MNCENCDFEFDGSKEEAITELSTGTHKSSVTSLGEAEELSVHCPDCNAELFRTARDMERI